MEEGFFGYVVMPSQRSVFLGGFGLCAALIAIALYFQYVLHFEPCPLCIVQRVLVMALGAVMLAAALHNPRGWAVRLYGVLIVVIATAGIGVAARHVWLQHLPADQVPSCGPGLYYMLRRFPLHQALALVLKGTGECAAVVWRFLGLSIPGWTLVVFSALALGGLYVTLRRRTSRV